MTFRYTDPDDGWLEVEPDWFSDGTPAVYIDTTGPVRIAPDRVEDVITAIREAARALENKEPTTCEPSP